MTRLAEPIEWLTDNGSPYVASETRRFARDSGLVPRTTPASSRQSHGRPKPSSAPASDYVRVNPKPDAHTVIEQLPAWLTHYNEIHLAKGVGLSLAPRVHQQNSRDPSEI